MLIAVVLNIPGMANYRVMITGSLIGCNSIGVKIVYYLNGRAMQLTE